MANQKHIEQTLPIVNHDGKDSWERDYRDNSTLNKKTTILDFTNESFTKQSKTEEDHMHDIVCREPACKT